MMKCHKVRQSSKAYPPAAVLLLSGFLVFTVVVDIPIAANHLA